MSQILVGIDEIARYLRVSRSTVKRMLSDMHDAGVCFRMWRGRPPKLRICAFTDRLQAWVASADTDVRP